MSATAVPKPSGTDGPDPHGHAALLLVESLIHGLVSKRVLSVAEAVEVVEVAKEAQIAIVEAGQPRLPTTGLLEDIQRSLEIDLPR